KRGRIVGKLDNDVARARVAFDAFELASTHDVTCPEFFEYRLVAHRVGLIAILALHIDPPDPITLGHTCTPYDLAACSISATIASAAALGSRASRTGRPTTRYLAPASIARAGVTILF